MGSEKNQPLFIGTVFGLIIMTVLMFVLIGGEFHFLFIRFSADGIFGNFLWIIPLIMIAVQQLYVIPTFMQSYWTIFSDEPPTTQEIYVPVLNENVVFQNDTLIKITYALWVIIGIVVLVMITPALSFFGTGSDTVTLMFYAGVLVVICFLSISLMRGFKYLAIRRDIYDYHNKYMGIRGTSPFFWLYKLLYFVPLGRSISLLSDIQIMDKLTKYNDVEKMKTELFEEE